MEQETKPITEAQIAFDLVETFKKSIWKHGNPHHVLDISKECAITCVDEIQKRQEEIFHNYGIGFMGQAIARNDFKKSKMYKFYEQVKIEIQKIT